MLSGRMTGTWGRAAAYSFYPTKNLGALGDGGAVVTNDPRRRRRGRACSGNTAGSNATSASMAGMNSRLDELQAAILRVKLLSCRRKQPAPRLARLYDEGSGERRSTSTGRTGAFTFTTNTSSNAREGLPSGLPQETRDWDVGSLSGPRPFAARLSTPPRSPRTRCQIRKPRPAKSSVCPCSRN